MIKKWIKILSIICLLFTIVSGVATAKNYIKHEGWDVRLHSKRLLYLVFLEDCPYTEDSYQYFYIQEEKDSNNTYILSDGYRRNLTFFLCDMALYKYKPYNISVGKADGRYYIKFQCDDFVNKLKQRPQNMIDIIYPEEKSWWL